MERSAAMVPGWCGIFAPEHGWVTRLAVVADCGDVRSPDTASSGAQQRPVVILDSADGCAATDLHARDCVRRLVTLGFAVLVRGTLEGRHLTRIALAVGASGAIDRAASGGVIRDAVRALAHGGTWTDPTAGSSPSAARRRVPDLALSEATVLSLYGGGLTLESAARRMGVQAGTARTYLDRVRHKYRQAGRPIRSRVDYTLRAVEDGYLRLG